MCGHGTHGSRGTRSAWARVSASLDNYARIKPLARKDICSSELPVNCIIYFMSIAAIYMTYQFNDDLFSSINCIIVELTRVIEFARCHYVTVKNLSKNVFICTEALYASDMYQCTSSTWCRSTF